MRNSIEYVFSIYCSGIIFVFFGCPEPLFHVPFVPFIAVCFDSRDSVSLAHVQIARFMLSVSSSIRAFTVSAYRLRHAMAIMPYSSLDAGDGFVQPSRVLASYPVRFIIFRTLESQVLCIALFTGSQKPVTCYYLLKPVCIGIGAFDSPSPASARHLLEVRACVARGRPTVKQCSRTHSGHPPNLLGAIQAEWIR